MNNNRYGNLIDNSISYCGDTHQVTSPVTNRTVGKVTLASRPGISDAISDLAPSKPLPSRPEVFAFLKRLHAQLENYRDRIFEHTYLETGFIADDSDEIVDGAIEYLSDFEAHTTRHKITSALFLIPIPQKPAEICGC